MTCPKCGGPMQVQAVSELQKRGCLTVIFYLILLCIPILGWIVLFILLRGRKSKIKSYAVCQRCGFRIEAEKLNAQKPTPVAHTATAPKISSPKKVDVTIPRKIGDCQQVYRYDRLTIAPVADAVKIALEMQRSGDWELDAVKVPSGVELQYHGAPFAALTQKEDMVSDWLDRGDPLFACLGNVGDSGNSACIAFYRDEMKRLASHENIVVKLIRCTNEEAQLNLTLAEEGDKLELEEDYEHEDSVVVLLDGSEIGALPKRQAIKYMEEGCAGVFLDHLDTDDNCRDIPYVKIYW